MKLFPLYLILLVVSGFGLVSEAKAQLLAETQALTLEATKIVAAAAEAEARANDWDVVIAIVDAGGHLFYLQRMDDVQIGSVRVAQQKARTAALFRRPSKVFADRMANGNNATLGLPDVIPNEGGLPIVVDGQVIGGIGVSGVRSEDDATIAQAGIDALLARLGQ